MFKGIDLPQIAVGIRDPEFGLPCITALDPFFPLSSNSLPFQSLLNGHKIRRGGQPESDMVECPAGCKLTGMKRQYDRRISDIEFGIVGEMLHWVSTQEQSIKLDRPIEVGH